MALSSSRLLWAGLAALFPLSAFCATVPTGASLPEGAPAVTILVDLQGDDAGDGSVDRPLRTIQAAITHAMKQQKAGETVLVKVGPGTFRETVRVSGRGVERGGAVSVEGAGPGKTILSGAETRTEGWTETENGIWENEWTHKWGLVGNPWQGHFKVTIGDLAKRRELVAVNGSNLDQVEKKSQLSAGSFFVDEEKGKLLVFPPEGVSLNSAEVEVGRRTRLLEVRDVDGFAIRGFTFQHAISHLGGNGAVQFHDSSNLVVENCEVIWNGWKGLTIVKASQVTVRDVDASNNGGQGMGASHIQNAVMERFQTNSNNWRGMRGKFYGWDLAGMKIFACEDLLIRDYRSEGNVCPGLWFDWHLKNVTIENTVLANNFTSGLGLEAGDGPFILRNVQIINNKGPGLHIHGAANILVESSVIADNLAQVTIWYDNRKVPNPFDPNAAPFKTSDGNINCTFRNTIISSSLPGWLDWAIEKSPGWWGMRDLPSERRQPLFHPMSPRAWEPFFSSLKLENVKLFLGGKPEFSLDSTGTVAVVGLSSPHQVTILDAPPEPQQKNQAAIIYQICGDRTPDAAIDSL